MALKPCPECGKELSRDATQCPGCGAYTGNVPDGRKVVVRFVFLGLLLAVIWWVLFG
jgi:Zn finger protein HypA/HybF involved in hydrogenase expression